MAAIRVTLAEPAQAGVVHRDMRAAFAVHKAALRPPSGALGETVAGVEQAMVEGGAVLAWCGDEPVGSARFGVRPDDLHVDRLAVLPTHRRPEVASVMVRSSSLAINSRASVKWWAGIEGGSPGGARP